MSRYHPSAHYGIVAGDVSGAHEHREDRDRYDRDSPGTDMAPNYTQYLHHARDDSDSEAPEDPHLALTSQTLNADGTPKRPMNAFMIFARKRRPQISAANQMMRTGDISKILSKEWNTMEMSEKKFYLDQAKKLKDTFNSKYPDYVYRRRPNNSRKKRKTDSEHSPQGLSSSAEAEDLDDGSPIDSDEPIVVPPGEVYPYPQAHATSVSTAYETHGHFAPASPGYSQPSDFSSGQYGQPPARMGHLSSAAAPIRLSSLTDTSASPPTYPPHTSQYTNPPLYSAQDSRVVHNPWGAEASRESGRQERAAWPVLPALDTNMARPRTSTLLALQNEKPEPYSPQLSHRSWSGSAPSSSSGASANYSSSAFPTLTSAFYPGASPSQRALDSAGSPSHAHEYQHSPAVHMPRGLPFAGRQGEQGSFTQSTTLPLPTANAYMTPAQNVNGWQSSPYRSGTLGAQRLSPPSLPGVTLPPPTTSAENASQMAYWDRRYEGR